MSIGTGVSGQFGLGTESEWGAPVTVDTFYEVESASITPDTEVIEPQMIGRGLVQRGDRRKTIVYGANGKSIHYIMTKGDGQLFQHALGSSQSAQVGETAEYKQTHIPDVTTGKRGLGATVQIGLPAVDGTVIPMTGEGGKVTEFKFSAAIGEPLKLELSWLFEEAKTNTALASKSFPSGAELFYPDEITLTVDSNPIDVSSVELTGATSLADGRRFLGRKLRKEPLANALWAFSGKFNIEWESLDAYNAWVDGTPATLVVTATGGLIPTTSNPYKVVITVTDIYYTGEVPELEGPDILTHDVPFDARADGTNPVFKVEYHTSDTAI